MTDATAKPSSGELADEIERECNGRDKDMEFASPEFTSILRQAVAILRSPPVAGEPFDVMATIDPNYAESFDRPVAGTESKDSHTRTCACRFDLNHNCTCGYRATGTVQEGGLPPVAGAGELADRLESLALAMGLQADETMVSVVAALRSIPLAAGPITTAAGSVERYFLKAAHQTNWDEVSKEQWIRAERASGFRPKLWSGDPEYMTTCATGGFSGCGVSGKIELEPLATASPVAGAEGGVRLPTYGSLSWDELGMDVMESLTDRRSPFKFDEKFYPGHQGCGINFNSLARIVDKYRLASPPSVRPMERSDLRERIARIININGFMWHDSAMGFKARERAFAKADAILALSANQPVATERAALLAAKEFVDDEFSYATDLNRKNRICRLYDLINRALAEQPRSEDSHD